MCESCRTDLSRDVPGEIDELEPPNDPRTN
jgi:hypothetical protein